VVGLGPEGLFDAAPSAAPALRVSADVGRRPIETRPLFVVCADFVAIFVALT
jgi:hypothetical protein